MLQLIRITVIAPARLMNTGGAGGVGGGCSCCGGKISVFHCLCEDPFGTIGSKGVVDICKKETNHLKNPE